ncbi:hypothetical protein SAMN05421688_2173 [Poseidonocella pacifica]|uniref:Cyclopropane-fatty-acyl-phospholipid synthase n=1 Tax=Poseidonocella pacifica TaxID=871651 RepID=A0A1I0XEB4_9RHOB|nr:DUF1365 domain-containing protein [Poseidonocella pacifica]SFA99224.1 hypothetical protein SAMN05421688_2173 [Poseidonocella pacifica]
MSYVEHIAAHTCHMRRGTPANVFRYSVDYVLVDAEAKLLAPRLFSRNGRNLLALNDRDHGGAPGHGRGAEWARDVLREHSVTADGPMLLLAQPRTLGHVFNPVSFWLAHDTGRRLRAVIAEVTNTFGERHSYLCVKPDRTPIVSQDVLVAQKIFYVSPFQPIEGHYEFRFDIRLDRIGISIENRNSESVMIATLTGPRRPLTTPGSLALLARRPFGSRRVLALIFWQALKLRLKGGRYRVRPRPPEHAVSCDSDVDRLKNDSIARNDRVRSV